MSQLLVKKLSENATIPTRATKDSAGYDLHSAIDIIVRAKGKGLVKTDIAIKIPEGCYAHIFGRSGVSWKSHIGIGAGVIDRDYTGNVGIVLFNHSDEDFIVKVGDRIAQLILEKISTPDVVEVDSLDKTERGTSGFGSTGV